VKHVLLFHEVPPDYLDRRAEHRSAHLAHAWAAHERGEILLAGALADPPGGAALLFAAKTKAWPRPSPGRILHREWSRRALARA